MMHPQIFRPSNKVAEFICYHNLDTLNVPYRVIVLYDGHFVSCPERYVILPDVVKVYIPQEHDATKYQVCLVPEECLNDAHFVDTYVDGLTRRKILKESDVICNGSNNSEHDKEGRLSVDLIFYGSLAQHVRNRLDRLACDESRKDQHNPS